jgi:hypothetical protein
MIDPTMLKEAIRTGHDSCVGKDGCVHEKAIQASIPDIEKEIAMCIAYSLTEGISPALMVFSMALHVGYRLHALEHTPIDHAKAN